MLYKRDLVLWEWNAEDFIFAFNLSAGFDCTENLHWLVLGPVHTDLNRRHIWYNDYLAEHERSKFAPPVTGQPRCIRRMTLGIWSGVPTNWTSIPNWNLRRKLEAEKDGRWDSRPPSPIPLPVSTSNKNPPYKAGHVLRLKTKLKYLNVVAHFCWCVILATNFILEILEYDISKT